MPRGQWSIRLRTEVINFDEFSDAELKGFAAQGLEDVHSIKTHHLGTAHTHLQWDFLLELNGEMRRKNKIAGKKTLIRGGSVIDTGAVAVGGGGTEMRHAVRAVVAW